MHTCIHILYDIILYHIRSYYIISYQIISYQIILYYILYIYIPGNPKASFFSIIRGWHVFSVITGLLVRLKARSEEPKYVLLTRVKSKKTFGFLWGFYKYFSAFFWRILGSIKLTCFFHQMLLMFSQDETGTYRLLAIFCSHYGKKHAKLEIRLWKHVITSNTAYDRKTLTFGFPGIYILYKYTYKQFIHVHSFSFFSSFSSFSSFPCGDCSFFQTPKKRRNSPRTWIKIQPLRQNHHLWSPLQRNSALNHLSTISPKKIPDPRMSQNNHRRTSHQVISLHI